MNAKFSCTSPAHTTTPACPCCGPSLVRTRRTILLTAAALTLAAATTSSQTTPWPLTQVAPGLYVRPGVIADSTPQNLDAIANTGFIVGSREVCVIDPGGSLADGARLRAAIRAITPLPITTLVLSHVHPDHIFGAGAFAADHPAILGHARLPEALASRGEYYRKRLADQLGEAATGPVPVVTRTITGEATIDLGGRRLRLLAHPPAHTYADLTVFDERSNSLWAADLLFVQRIPSLDGSLEGWLAQLHGPLIGIKADRAIPGHGPAAVAWPAAAADETRYLQTLKTDVAAAIARGADISATVHTAAASEQSRWALFDGYNGRNVTEAYKELEWE